ncbi:MAG: transketolase [Firmicutes bacterium]|nr:transketolase [Bacillota bacterium]
MLDTIALARTMRQEIIKMLTASASGHPGGSLSATDFLAVLYGEFMNVDPAEPRKADRDRFVLTKGHAAPALYAILALKGFFPMEELANLRKLGSPLQGHPDMHKVPGVDASTGSLGQGLSLACGMALAAKMDGQDYRVYALMGDGEQQEGQVWEAAMFAAHYKLDNLVILLDHNHLQIDGNIADVLNPDPLDEKYRAFGWNVIQIDGHDHEQIRTALAQAREVKGQPTVIIGETVKGKGVSFMENQAGWHGKAPNAEQSAQALAELEG